MTAHTEATRIRASEIDRYRAYILSHVTVSESGCWLWTGSLTHTGYARTTSTRHRFVRAHRLSYAVFVGPIPRGKPLDHQCRVRHCVNPEHLEPVTPRENALRSPTTVQSVNAAKTHCNSGHALIGPNLYVWRGYRHCRTCRTAARRKHLKVS